MLAIFGSAALQALLGPVLLQQIDGSSEAVSSSHQVQIQPSFNKRRVYCLAPISRLPLETLISILTLSIPHEDWSFNRLLQLSQVSTAWRAAVIETPQLWAVAKLNRLIRGDPRWQEKLGLALSRSKGFPLSVICAFGCGFYSTGAIFVERKAIESFIGVVVEHVTRWKKFSYTGFFFMDIVNHLEQPAPLLECLKLHFDNAHSYPTRQIKLHASLRLRSVDLCSVMISETSLQNLRSLRLRDIHLAPDQSISYTIGFLSVLRSCPKLEVLSLKLVDGLQDTVETHEESVDDYIQSLEKVHLSDLRVLEMESCDLPLSLAIAFGIHAESISQLSFWMPSEFQEVIFAAGTNHVFGPALARAIARSSRAYITMAPHISRIYSPFSHRCDQPKEEDFDFQFYGWHGVGAAEGLVIKFTNRALWISGLGLPFSVDVGHSGEENDFDIPLILRDFHATGGLRVTNRPQIVDEHKALYMEHVPEAW
ncbi:hypothetical protein FRB95_007641 [Tulasnella sp. JGI-2019a]|nr:hypothetical protein FRB95_007641 [Tulasnella sp. JGI-2019a]